MHIVFGVSELGIGYSSVFPCLVFVSAAIESSVVRKRKLKFILLCVPSVIHNVIQSGDKGLSRYLLRNLL